MIRCAHLIINVAGGLGGNASLAYRAADFFARRGIQSVLHATESRGHARRIAQTVAFRPGEILCVVGGDGTIHEAVNGIMRRPPEQRPPLAPLPGGTGNAFLHDLDLLNPERALNRIVSNCRRSIDLLEARVDGEIHYAFNVLGWGLFASGNQRAESMRWIGRRRYFLSGLLEILAGEPFEAELSLDGRKEAGSFALIAASNTKHTGAGMLLSPNARLDDGKLDLHFVKQAGRIGLLWLLTQLRRGTHVHSPEVEYIQTDQFVVETRKPGLINIDGELLRGKKCEVKVVPAALEMAL